MLHNHEIINLFLEILPYRMPQALIERKGMHPAIECLAMLLLNGVENTTSPKDCTQLSRGIKICRNPGCFMIESLSFYKEMQHARHIAQTAQSSAIDLLGSLL